MCVRSSSTKLKARKHIKGLVGLNRVVKQYNQLEFVYSIITECFKAVGFYNLQYGHLFE